MQRTTNLLLKKPDYTDPADIKDINDNMDAIDEAFGEQGQEVVIADGVPDAVTGLIFSQSATNFNYITIQVDGYGLQFYGREAFFTTIPTSILPRTVAFPSYENNGYTLRTMTITSDSIIYTGRLTNTTVWGVK